MIGLQVFAGALRDSRIAHRHERDTQSDTTGLIDRGCRASDESDGTRLRSYRFVMRRSDVYYVPDGPVHLTKAVAHEADCAPAGARAMRTVAKFSSKDDSTVLWRATAERLATVQGCASAEAQVVKRMRGGEQNAVQCFGVGEVRRVTCEEGRCMGATRD